MVLGLARPPRCWPGTVLPVRHSNWQSGLHPITVPIAALPIVSPAILYRIGWRNDEPVASRSARQLVPNRVVEDGFAKLESVLAFWANADGQVANPFVQRSRRTPFRENREESDFIGIVGCATSDQDIVAR